MHDVDRCSWAANLSNIFIVIFIYAFMHSQARGGHTPKKILTLKELINAACGLSAKFERFLQNLFLRMPEFETFCDTNFCGWVKMKKISILISWNHLRKMKIADNKMNVSYFINEKYVHIKLFLHINTYDLFYSHRKRF